MKLSCEVIRDLLPLYEDAVCCEESRRLVEEHLAECRDCKALLERFQIPEKELLHEKEISLEEEEKSIRRSFRKLKRRWLLSLAAMLLVIPVIYVGVMIYHEYRGEGICFTNLDEILLCGKFFQLLEEENYDEAAEMMDFGRGYQSICEFMEGDIEEEDRAWYDKYYSYISGMSEEEYIQKQQDVFVKFMKENHVLIQRARYSDAYRSGTEWVIEYIVTEHVINDGSDRIFRISMGIHDGKLRVSSASYGFERYGLNPPGFLDIFFRKFE